MALTVYKAKGTSRFYRVYLLEAFLADQFCRLVRVN